MDLQPQPHKIILQSVIRDIDEMSNLARHVSGLQKDLSKELVKSMIPADKCRWVTVPYVSFDRALTSCASLVDRFKVSALEFFLQIMKGPKHALTYCPLRVPLFFHHLQDNYSSQMWSDQSRWFNRRYGTRAAARRVAGDHAPEKGTPFLMHKIILLFFVFTSAEQAFSCLAISRTW
jgi:hypothetical protein